MFRMMVETLDSGDEGFEVCSDFETESQAWDWWNIMCEKWPERVGAWVEPIAGCDEFFQGWEEDEKTDAWDGES